MSKILYFLVTFLESGLAFFGIRGIFEEPPFHLDRSLGDAVEIRSYPALTAVETTADNDGFGRLFSYIAGGNRRSETIAMTAPVLQTGGAYLPGIKKDGGTIMFVLPAKAAHNPPVPDNPAVHVVELPPQQLAVIRFSGALTKASVAEQEARLSRSLKQAALAPAGDPIVLGYDPPFTIPFLRRNEVAVPVSRSDARPAPT